MNEKELKEAFKNLQVGLEKMKVDQLKNQERRYWGKTITIPFTLHEGLAGYTKYELDDIRRYLDLKGVSSLKKAELIAVLEEEIPESLGKFCLQLDEERFNLLINLAKNGGYMHVADYEFHKINYFRASGLVYSGTYNGEKALVIPNELMEPILSLANHLNIRSVIKRNTEWIKLTTGFLYYYGTLGLIQIEELLKTYTKEPFVLHEYIMVMHEAISYHKDVYVDAHGYSHRDVDDYETVKKEHRMRKSLSFYPFKKNQILKASEANFVDRNESYIELVNFIRKNYELSREEADILVEDCVTSIRNGDILNEVLELLGSELEFDSMETVQAFADLVVSLVNNTREWFLKGYTPTELSDRKKSALQPLPETKLREGKKVVKVGRNEPCPCGSGKKYKKCCGR